MEKILKKVYEYLKTKKISSMNNKDDDDSEYLFVEKKLSELDETCSDLDLEVIDFDRGKREFTKLLQDSMHLNISEVPSCDALKILPELCKFDLIEMKSIKDVIETLPSNKVDKEQIIEKACEKYKEACKNKYIYSVLLLQILLIYSDCGLNKNEKKRLKEMSKNFYLLSDYDIKENPKETFALSLEVLSHPSNRDYKRFSGDIGQMKAKEIDKGSIEEKGIEEKIELMVRVMKDKLTFSDSMGWNFNKPKLVNSKELYYIYHKDLKVKYN